MTILTPQQSKAARKALGLSQSMVARKTGLNRSTLALFEVNKYLLEDRNLSKLRDFYMDQGYGIEEDAKSASGNHASPPPAEQPPACVDDCGYTVRDGFCIPLGLDHEDVEAALDEIHANDERIAEMLGQSVKRDWFTDKILTEPVEEVRALMASNYMLIRHIQGHVLSSSANDSKGDKPDTYADFLARG